jgi:hypothetical protein
MKELIERTTGLSLWVQGVVAVWGELPGGTEECDKVLHVRGPNLAEVLQTGQARRGAARRGQRSPRRDHEEK